MPIENPQNGCDKYNAIETDKGILLFSRTYAGINLFHDYVRLFMDNLYNPKCNNTYFNLHYIESRNPELRDKCDMAFEFPDKNLALVIPIKDECYTDTSVLKDSLTVKVNGWEPTPEQIRRITDSVDGVYIPVRGDTFDISSLQEMASGVSYNRVLLSGAMSDFKYEKEFLELAKKMEQCTDMTEAGKLSRDIKKLASDILKRDFPDMRTMPELPARKRLPNEYGKYDHLRKDGPDCFNAIEVDNGVLLFSRTVQGKELFEKTLETYLNNFYNPACNTSCFNLHYLECDNGALKGMSDLAIKFLKMQVDGFPPNPCLFIDKDVLKYSFQEAKFSWKPELYAANELMNDTWDGKHLPMKMDGDTYNISVLKEIASMEFYYFTSLADLTGHDMLGIDRMPGFRYKEDFRELADKAINFSGHIHEYKVLGAMGDKANEILKRDFPDIRKELEISKKESMPIAQASTQKKRGIGL